MDRQNWYTLEHTEQLITPSLLIFPDRIAQNIARMLAMAGGTQYLRPHIKTHKSAEIIRMQMKRGIRKFKCATIPEAALLGQCGASDILLAMQPVGANIGRFFDLIEAYPQSEFSTIVDNQNSIEVISSVAVARDKIANLYLDLNTGMNRTGVVPGAEAAALFISISMHPNLCAKGLHAYDGHVRHPNPTSRKNACDIAFRGVLRLRDMLEAKDHKVENIVAGGSPTFPFHAKRPGVESSPGTTLLWDEGYKTLFPEMGFLVAAVLLTRIVSKPQPSIICLDLGHKAIAPEMDYPRVRIFGMEDCEQIGQSEEHLVLRCPENNGFEVGDLLYAIPRHICPTVAKYPALLTVENGHIAGSWKVAARDH